MVGPQKGLCRPVDGYPVTSKNMAYEDLGFRCCRGEEWTAPRPFLGKYRELS